MAITHFVPTIWSETLYTELDKKFVGIPLCNRDYEGEITKQGSVVKICGPGKINVSDYKKNTDISAPQVLIDTGKTLEITKAKYFNFLIDDIDRTQAMPKLMTAAMNTAADALAVEAEKYVYTLFTMAGKRMKFTDVSVNNILDYIIDARTVLYQKNVTDSYDVSLEISPDIANILLKAKILNNSDNSEALDNGYLGKVAGCKVYVSNNLSVVTSDDDGSILHRCIMRTKRAITFAQQLSKIEAYRLQNRFADGVKGLYLFGASVVYPDELVTLEFSLPGTESES